MAPIWQRMRKAVVVFSILGALVAPACSSTPPSPPPVGPALDCPSTLVCKWTPAPYESPGDDSTVYGNYQKTDLPGAEVTLRKDGVVLHTTEGSLDQTLRKFQKLELENPVGAHYVLDRDGRVYQIVPSDDMPYHGNSWYANMHLIGIEIVGESGSEVPMTPAQERSTILLTQYLAERYQFPIDRDHILGHDNLSAPNDDRLRKHHWDPGFTFAWESLLADLDATPVSATSTETLDERMITVTPHQETNLQPIRSCGENGRDCQTVMTPVNFVYMRSEPRVEAPLMTDVVMGQGTEAPDSLASRVFYGQRFMLAGKSVRDGENTWYPIWNNGQKAWINSPDASPTVMSAAGRYVVPKPGVQEVLVYGQPLPAASAYPQDLLSNQPAPNWIQLPRPLSYKVAAGQKYALIDEVPSDFFYFWDRLADREKFPFDHTVFKGEPYVKVWLGSRIAFLKRDDVSILSAS